MKASFMVENPGSVVAEMKISMPIKEWCGLRGQLAERWPSSELSRKIGDLVAQASKQFYPTEEK